MLESEIPHFFPKMHLKVTFLINPYRLYFTVGIVNSRLPASGKHCQTHFIVLTVSLSSWQIRLVPVYLKQLVPAEVSTKGTPYPITPAAQQIYIAGKMEEEINDAKKFWG